MPDSLPAYRVCRDVPLWRNLIPFARINNVRGYYIIHVSIAPFAWLLVAFVILFGVFFFEPEASYLILYLSLCHFTVVDQHPVVMMDFLTFHCVFVLN